MDTVISSPKEELAEKLGLNASQIHGVKLQLSVLRKQGILVDLNVSGTSMFTRQAEWSEIGINEDEDMRAKRLTRGQKFLIPEDQVKRLRSIETRMRQWLDKLSFDVTGFRPYRWLPFTAYDKWREKWAELVGELESVKQDILDHYDDYVDRLSEDFNKVAAESWRSIVVAGGYQWIIVGGKPLDKDQFTDMVVHRALAKLPSREKIASDLHADYNVSMVFGQEEIAADEIASQAAWDAYMQQKAELEAKKHEAYLQSSILQEQYRHDEQMHRLEEEAKEAKIRAMMDAEAKHARQRLQEMASPFEEVFKALRERFAKDAGEILESIKKNGFVRGKVAERGRGLIDMFNLLSVQDDYELRGKLLALSLAIGPERSTENAPERSVDEITSVLEQIMSLEAAATADLLAGPSRFSNLDI